MHYSIDIEFSKNYARRRAIGEAMHGNLEIGCISCIINRAVAVGPVLRTIFPAKNEMYSSISPICKCTSLPFSCCVVILQYSIII